MPPLSPPPAPKSAYRRAGESLVFRWTAGTIALPGLAGLGAFAAFAPSIMTPVLACGLGTGWLACAAALGWSVAQVLGGPLSRPADALAAMTRVDGGIDVPARVTVAGLAAEYDRLEDALLRALHEKNGRLSEMARARDKALGENQAQAQFFANMSHELRTPLNAIIGYAMLLYEDANDAGETGMARDLDRILVSGRHLLALINDVLDLSRIEAGRVSIERSVVDVNGVIHALAAEFADETRRNGNSYRVFVAPNASVMLGDAVKLRQCLTTLLSNAFKFSSGGEVGLDVTLAPSKNQIRFSVSDRGGGIPAEALATLFDTIKAGEDSDFRKFDTTGLGLSVVKRMAGLMGGEILVDTTLGEGSVFTLGLPLSVAGETVPLTPSPAADGAATRKGGRVALVIDDDPATVDLARRWMGRQGYSVIAAHNGLDGLDMARTQKPDIILLDIYMPGVSGYEVLDQIRADPRLNHVPVLLCSSDDNRRLGLERGAAEVLVKPLSQDRLREVLDVLTGDADGEVLLVDDDPDAAEIVRRCASHAGLRVHQVFTSEQGLSYAREHPPKAIVLDLRMPDNDGFAMMDALASDDRLSTVPVLVLSASEINPHEHSRIRDAGHVFHAKGKSSPLQIVQNLKTMVAR